MSAAWFKLIATLCLCGMALTGQERGGVVWRDFGEAVTIQCRPPESDQECLNLKRGLLEDEVFFKESESNKTNFLKELTGRLLPNGDFPNVDILIKNLTSNDTGPYWCIYSRFDSEKSEYIHKKGNGSVLLVVTDMLKQCDPENKDVVLACVVLSAVTLVGFAVGILIWIILKVKVKTGNLAVKPQRLTTSDVYEDMRGTLRCYNKGVCLHT